jgi:N6-L-threonylcarbamoyladenine synthase
VQKYLKINTLAMFKDNEDIYILAIESSCDDTSAAVMKNTKAVSNIVANQKVHQDYGGVVPELASRAHQKNIIPVVDQALKTAGVTKAQLSAIAYTQGPGLMGALLVGNSFAKSMAMALNIPLIAVNHMQAHIMAHFIDDNRQQKPDFPFLALTISGGHTQIVLVKDYFDLEVIGSTLDDAIGEAFDKCGKLMKLPYPAGPHIDKLAKAGKPEMFTFAKPKVANLDFSFSGVKTSFRYFLDKKLKEDPEFINNNLKDLCASLQATLVDIIYEKMLNAARQYRINSIAIGGGVSANSAIRSKFSQLKDSGYNIYIPAFEYCTDNAAMIGVVGYYKYHKQQFTDETSIARSRFPIS